MKYSLVAVAFAAAASAQSLADIPSCALPCLQTAVTSAGCSATDVSCICKNFQSIEGSSTGCVVKACGATVATEKVLPAAEALCKSGGASSAPASSAPASSAPASSAPVSTPASSAAVTTPATTMMSSGVAAPTTAPVAGNTTAPSPPISTAGAATFGSIGAVAMVALGALAL